MVHGYAGELRKFANALAHFNDTLEQAAGQINGSFSALGETWQDQTRQAFEECFNELMQNLSRFKEVSAEQIPYLHNLAIRLDEYTNA